MTTTETTTDTTAPTPTLDEFKDEATAFLDANAAARSRRAEEFVWGEGNDDVALFEEVDPDVEARQLAEAKAWRAKRYDAGLGWISGPTELGGRGLPAAYDRLYGRLEAGYQVPDQASSASASAWWRPRSWPTAPTRSTAVPPPACTGATSSAASCSASPAPAPTSPASRRGPSATATSGSSPARRCGPRAPTTATSARSSAAPTPTCPSTRASPASSSTCTPPASRSGRCAR